MDKNIEKTDPSTEGQSAKDAVKIDVNAPLTLEESKAVVEAEGGQIEEAINKVRAKNERNIPLDVIKLKEEQKEKKEVKQKKQEIKEEIKEVKEEVKKEVIEEVKKAEKIDPSKFEGKSEAEKMKIYKDMESSFTKKSQRIAELEAKNAELAETNKKLDEFEKNIVVDQQKDIKVKIPPYPDKDLFYDDPEKYHQAIKAHYDAKLNAMVTPLYGENWANQKQRIINKLKKDSEKDIIPYTDVEKEVESRMKKNPAVLNQYKLKSREYFYNQIKNEKLPQKLSDMKIEAKKEAIKELEEERTSNNESQIMSSDITTQKRETAQVDFKRELDGGADPEKVIQAIKKKHGITADI